MALDDPTTAPPRTDAAEETTGTPDAPAHAGLKALLERPLLGTLWRRRTHRVSRGVRKLEAGSMTYESAQAPAPLSELEEAVLIACTGHTGPPCRTGRSPTRTPASRSWRSPT